MVGKRLKLMIDLYKKIKDGTATEKEQLRFNMEVARDSMSDELLLKLIKQEADK